MLGMGGGTRKRGRPRARWLDDIKAVTKCRRSDYLQFLFIQFQINSNSILIPAPAVILHNNKSQQQNIDVHVVCYYHLANRMAINERI